MQSIYFTALICYLPPPPKKQKQTNNKKDKNKLQTPVWPPHPSPTPIHSLNIYQLIQNISLAFSLKPVILITQGGREVELEKGKKKKQLKNASMPTLYVHEASPPPPHQMKTNFKNKQIWSKLTWFEWLHSENDIWFTYRWGYNTHTRTHRLAHKLIYT